MITVTGGVIHFPGNTIIDEVKATCCNGCTMDCTGPRVEAGSKRQKFGAIK